MNDKVRNYRDLEVWQKGIDLAKDIYQLTYKFPESEKYGLSDQLRRSAVSVPSNIAEGHARRNDKEFSYFIRVVLGSCAELDTQLIIASELDYISRDTADTFSNRTIEIRKMALGLLKRLNQ